MMKITGYLFHAVKFMGKVLQCFFVNLKMSKTYSSPHEYKLRLADNRAHEPTIVSFEKIRDKRYVWL